MAKYRTEDAEEGKEYNIWDKNLKDFELEVDDDYEYQEQDSNQMQ